jgi:hypothetical protein
MTPAQRSLYGRIGAAVARARHDPRDLTSEARRRFLARFEARIREDFPGLPDVEIQRRATELRRAWMLRLAAHSAEARRKKKAPARLKANALEVDRGSDHTTAPRS